MMIRLGILLLPVAVFLGACGPSSPPPDSDGGLEARVADARRDVDPSEVFDHPAEVLRVVDGDTIYVFYRGMSLKVRLKGVNTPELEPTPEPCSEEARDMTAYYAPPRGWVGLEFDDDRCAGSSPPADCFDLYDRLLAYIRTTSGADLGALLLSSGLARVYEAANFSRKAEYEALQAEAQRNGLCIWSQ